MSRIDTPEGSFFERRFTLAAPGPEGLRAALEHARAGGYLLHYQLDGQQQGQQLAIRRPWFDQGVDLRQLFRGYGPGEWQELSRDVFNGLWRRLEALEPFGHGAVHPGNVLFNGDDYQLLDAVANPLWLGLEPTSAEVGVWCWGRRVPSGWTLPEWDLVHLLRLVVLLGGGPEAWGGSLDDPTVLERGRTWLAAASSQAIGDAAKVLARIEALLARLPLPPPLPSGDAWLQQQLKELALEPRRRVLREAESTRLVQQAAAQGLAPKEAAHRVAVWLAVRGWKTEPELQRQVQVLLEGGIQAGSGGGLKLVSRNATDNAQRLLAGHGLLASEAEHLVKEVLARRGWTAETALEARWQPQLADFVRQHCPNRQYTRKQFEQMAERVTSFGLPRRLAERGVQRLLEQWGYQPEGA